MSAVIVQTASGSIYEVEPARARRLHGTPTARTAVDEWRALASPVEPVVGRRMLLCWRVRTLLCAACEAFGGRQCTCSSAEALSVLETTLTTPVTSISASGAPS